MKTKKQAVSPDLLNQMDAYWRAANYLSVGQIYLYDNPLLQKPLAPAHIKPRLLAHWGTTPGLNFIYVHMNRVIKEYGLNAIYVIVAGKQPAPQWLDMDGAVKHCTAGIGIWPWASNDLGGEPDVVLACCGDVPTLETLAAVQLLRENSLEVGRAERIELWKIQLPHAPPMRHLNSMAKALYKKKAEGKCNQSVAGRGYEGPRMPSKPWAACCRDVPTGSESDRILASG